jgi:hypothetical protein
MTSEEQPPVNNGHYIFRSLGWLLNTGLTVLIVFESRLLTTPYKSPKLSKLLLLIIERILCVDNYSLATEQYVTIM